MRNLALGIDTGGTFTDGVLFDLDRKEIVAKTKVITTRQNLTLAIDRCMEAILSQGGPSGQGPGLIKMVSLSTTLATNAIVEGQGAEVGLIAIGFAPQKGLPTTHYACVAGGCDLKGKFRQEVDLAAAAMAVAGMKEQVDAFAVSGYLSIRNPAQELAVEKLIREMTGYPVVCAHHLSSDLGFHERTVTAVLNARLMPLITGLLSAVRSNMDARGLDAPLMVVKGDGSLISEKMAREKPIETILSGPAASITGALTLTGIEDGIVIDIGGTTTDLAVLQGGRPSLNSTGARVGGWLTRVRAAEITTVGLGGDSYIEVQKSGALSIGPQRVFPLSWIASQYPYLVGELLDIRESEYRLSQTQPPVILVYIRDPLHLKLTETEERILAQVRDTPHTLTYISRKLGKDLDLLPWHRMVTAGFLHRASLTPTDILHVQGAIDLWDREAATLGARMLAVRRGTGVDQFCDAVLEEICRKLAGLVTGRLIAGLGGGNSVMDSTEGLYFLGEFLRRGKDKRPIEFSAQVNLPLVAVGAPAGAYLPEVARRLNAKVQVPESAEVANAVGTVSGKTVERVTVLVKPGEGGGFLVHAPWGREDFLKLEDALAYSQKEGEDFARRRAADSGAAAIKTVVERFDSYGSLTPGQGESDPENKLFIESVLHITAIGRPWGE